VKLDKITDRTAWMVFAGGFVASTIAAAFAPQDAKLGAWVRLVIWHGMLKWACILVIFAMGVVAVTYLVSKRQVLYDWIRALQVATMLAWVFAVMVGAASAKLVWNSWNLSERRMTMAVIYVMVSAAALIVGLLMDKPRLTAVLAVLTSVTMAGLLGWIELIPNPDDVHPANAVFSSPNIAFRVFGVLMLVTCLVWVVALVVPTRHWVMRVAHEGDSPIGPTG
jgi:hypothetical protein